MTPVQTLPFELTFFGVGLVDYWPAYERHHATLDDAAAEATRISDLLYEEDEQQWANRLKCHAGMVHGPGLGDMGVRLW